jgi:hypothetical protein
LHGAHDAAVNFDARVVADAGAELAHNLSSDAHASGGDQVFRAAARRNACRRQEFLEPLRRQCPLSGVPRERSRRIFVRVEER